MNSIFILLIIILFILLILLALVISKKNIKNNKIYFNKIKYGGNQLGYIEDEKVFIAKIDDYPYEPSALTKEAQDNERLIEDINKLKESIRESKSLVGLSEDELKDMDAFIIAEEIELQEAEGKLQEFKNLNKDTVYFYLRQITTLEDCEYWKTFIDDLREKTPAQIRGFNPDEYIELQAGIHHLYSTINNGFGPCESNFHNLYIAYSSNKYFKTLPKWQDIEVIFSVIAKNNICISTHLGIFRLPQYYTKPIHWKRIRSSGRFSTEYPYKKYINQSEIHYHQKLSIALHTFAGVTIQKILPLYKGMITSPTIEMRSLLIKTIDLHGLQYALELMHYRETQFKLFDKTGEQVVEITPDSILFANESGNPYTLPPWLCGIVNNIFDSDGNRISDMENCYILESSNLFIFIPIETFNALFQILKFIM